MLDFNKIAEWKALADDVTRHPPKERPFDAIGHRYAAKLAREAVPALLAEREQLLALLREVEWVDSGDEYGTCPICEGYAPVTPPDWIGANTVNCRIGHTPDCRLAAALRGTP